MVSWLTAHAAVTEAAEAAAGEPAPITMVGIDETHRGRPRWAFSVETGRWVRTDRGTPASLISPVIRACWARPRGRTSACVIGWLQARTPEFREAIRFVAIDPAAVYAKAVTTPGLLPNAILVVDHFHLVKLANEAVTRVRRRVIWQQQGRRGRRIDPAWANRRRLLTARERLSPKAFAAMWNSLIDSDPPVRSSPLGSPRKNYTTYLHSPAPPRTVTNSANGSTSSTTGVPPPTSTS